jgi:hypothetical protein
VPTPREIADELRAVELQLRKAEREIKGELVHPAIAMPSGVSALSVAESLGQSSMSAAVDGAQSVSRAGIAV